ncbi:hypothetical protein ABZ858_00240 [Streptomyces sp. NPDC047017]|uniref:hypothetical protein n=1 Tax=Streptomyces sp. NPDC047017 TaxID=3155024 RepID=UPI003403899F
MLPHNTPVRWDGLEHLRRDYMLQLTEAIERSGRQVKVAPYALATSGDERRADLALIARYADAAGLRLTSTSFADEGSAPPVEQRSGFCAARRFAREGFAHGILAIARPAITTDAEVYERVLTDLFEHRIFLAFLPIDLSSLADCRPGREVPSDQEPA